MDYFIENEGPVPPATLNGLVIHLPTSNALMDYLDDFTITSYITVHPDATITDTSNN